MDQTVQSTLPALVDLDASIEALAIIQGEHNVTKLQNRLQKTPEAGSQIRDRFIVTDLLKDASYIVSRFDSHFQLLVAFKEHLIVADINSQTDFTEVVDNLVNQLSA